MRRFIFVLSILIFASQFFLKHTKASGSACDITSVSPASVNKNVSNTNLTFTLNNTGSSTISWVKFTSPSSTNFTVQGGISGGFVPSNDSGSITFVSGSLAAGSNTTFAVTIQSGTSDAGAASWGVSASDDNGGAGAVGCSGNTAVAVSGSAPDTSAPVFSNLTVSEITGSSAKISWTTDEGSTTVVNYGTADSYGSTKSDTSMVTSHSIVVDGLSADTTYHYDAVSTDGSSNTGDNGDSTFITAKAGLVVVTSTPTPTPVGRASSSARATPTPYVDRIPPFAELTTDLSKPFVKAPQIKGTASDNMSVSKIEFSLDDGTNWLPVDHIANPGAAATAFDFQPGDLEDDNYKIKIRATDSTGNIGLSITYTMIIDRLPPQIGTTLVSFGPQILVPPADGVVYTTAGYDQKITASAVGGPIAVDLDVGTNQIFSMVKDTDTGLWSGTISVAKPGTYRIMAKAVDGAGNRTKRTLNTVVVLENGRILASGKPVNKASVAVYYFEPVSKQFVLWDGNPYGVVNPQKTDNEGKYKLFIPQGKYYLKVSASGYKDLVTNIFTVKQSLPVNSNFELEPLKVFKIGLFAFTLPSFDQTQAEIAPILPPAPEQDQADVYSLIGKELPGFTLTSDKDTLQSVTIRGKNTVLTFLSSWSPVTSDQITQLEKLYKVGMIDSIAVFSGESVSKVTIFQKRGLYDLPMWADPDGVLINKFNFSTTPTHLFIDRKGIVKAVKVGLMSGDQLSAIFQ